MSITWHFLTTTWITFRTFYKKNPVFFNTLHLEHIKSVDCLSTAYQFWYVNIRQVKSFYSAHSHKTFPMVLMLGHRYRMWDTECGTRMTTIITPIKMWYDIHNFELKCHGWKNTCVNSIIFFFGGGVVSHKIWVYLIFADSNHIWPNQKYHALSGILTT